MSRPGPHPDGTDGTDDNPRPSGERLYRLAWGVYLALAVAGAGWIALRDGIGLRTFLDPATLWIDLAWGAAAAVGLLALWELGRRLLASARELEATFAELLRGLGAADALALALISGLAEELFFRGALQGSIGLVWAALLFALVHTGPGAAFRLWTLFALVAGFLLGLLVEVRGVLLPAIVAHALVNGASLTRLALRPPPGRPTDDPDRPGS